MASLSNHFKNYDAFLSFRGEDTRRTIVSYLYEALCREGIFTFRDDRRLEAGDNISDQLIEAIQTSWFAVVVISKNYATSKWCLEELRLIMELHGANQIQVVPMFYGVEPTDVRNQTGSFKAAFQNFEDLDTAPERVSQWRRALNQVGHLAGFHSTTWRDEATMISETVQRVSSGLLKLRPTSGVDIVGMEAHMLKMHFLLNMGSKNEVLMIGIWGMGGVGKTTIAKCLYERFSSQFLAHYFIEDIKKIYKDKSPSYLQERFFLSITGQQIDSQRVIVGPEEIKARLKHQKVLVVLDGVDKAEQVHALARETNWFGRGSRIIITTQDRGLLASCGVQHIHEVKCLDDMDALQVFKKSVFGGRMPHSYEFEQLFIRASRLAHGLPSALVAYASHLSENTTIERWEDELRLLETLPHKNVEEVLRNSYDGLDNYDKIAFLHVACLFNGYPFNHVTSLLDAGYPRIDHLLKKSLLRISTDGCINMHFLVVQTGKEIVRQECKNRPFRQRFLWDADDIYNVLDNNIGTDETEGLILHMCNMRDTLTMSNTVFEVMRSIKFLKFFHHLSDIKPNLQLKSDGFYFPPDLKLLHWDACPLKTLPSRFRHHQLVQVNLPYSNLKSLWDDTLILRNLQRLDVTGSKNLIQLPKLSRARNFEELIVEGCKRLQKIPKSLKWLHKLTKLNASHCDSLKCILFNVDSSLNGVNRRVCFKFPDARVIMVYLKDLSIDGQIHFKLSGLYGFIEHISFRWSNNQEMFAALVMMKESTSHHLTSYTVSHSLNIKKFRYRESSASFTCQSFSGLGTLTELKMVNLNINVIPDDIDSLLFLEKLDLSGNDFVHLPTTMGTLPKLKYLSLHNCLKITSLPTLAQVETLILSECVKLRSLMELHVEEAWATTYCLRELWLDNCKDIDTLSEQLSHLTKLTYLDLSRSNFVRLPQSIRELSSLETLYLNNCRKLKSVKELPQSVKYLYARGCDSLEKISLSSNHSIKHLDILHCPRLKQEEHENLMDLFIHDDGQSEEVSLLPSTCLFFVSLFNVDSITCGDNRKVVLSFSSKETTGLGCLKDLSIDGQIHLKLSGLYGFIEHISCRSKQHIPDESVGMEQSTSHQLNSDSTVLHSLNIKKFRYRESNASFTCQNFSGLAGLTELKLVNLNIKHIPDDIDRFLTLEKLDLSGNDFVHLPTTMGTLPKLKYLSLHNCRKITSLPQLAQVDTLILSECVKLRSLLEEAWATTYCLLEIWLDNCKHIETLSEQLSHFTKLTYLDLSRNNFLRLPQSIRELSSLETLHLNNCKKLKSVEELPQSVKYLYAHGCDSLEKVSLSSDHSVKHLDILHCPRLKQEEHENLMDLFIHDDGQSEEGSRPCACLRETGGSSNSSNETSETFKKFGQTRKLYRSIKSVFS